MASEAVPSRVPSSARMLTVGWSRRRRAVSRRNPTLAARRSARDGIHDGGLYGGGLPTFVLLSSTGREGSAASIVANRASQRLYAVVG
jgi:hypothetical protein